MIEARVQAEPFDVGAELARLEALGGGAVASFTGTVRGGDGLLDMTLEHYPAMTERSMNAILDQAHARWSLLGALAIHRVGTLGPGERIVLVATTASHRGDALESCAYLIDWLKTAAPFWKRERFENGSARWVEARAADDATAARWGTGGS
jgi:molybdopterin synthase catalytic subunit